MSEWMDRYEQGFVAALHTAMWTTGFGTGALLIVLVVSALLYIMEKLKP